MVGGKKVKGEAMGISQFHKRTPSSEWTRRDSSIRGEQSKIYLMIYLSKWAKLILGEKWFPRKILIRLKQIRNQRREREYLWPIKMRGSKIIIKWKITKIREMTDKMREWPMAPFFSPSKYLPFGTNLVSIAQFV